jgi:ABC-2 type transport system ATP-binding protein
VTQKFSLRHEKTLRGLFVTKVLRRHPTKEDFLALDDVNLEIAAGSTIGLIGHNGSGKSTLLKIIGGVLTPTRGEVRRRGSLAALLELGAGFHHDLTGRENVFLNADVLGIPRDVARDRFDEIVDFSGVEQFIDTPMKFYSSGMFVRLGFAVAIYAEPDILLVDEVLAVGDEAFQRKCLDVVRRFQREGRTIVLVTHDMRQVEEFCDRVVLLDHGRVRADGEPGRAIADFRELLGHPEMEDRQAPPVVVNGVEVGARRSGDRTTLDVVCQLEGSADCVLSQVQLMDESGALLYEASGKGEGYVGPIDGQQRVQVRIMDLPLAAGEYRVVVRVGEDGRWHHASGNHRFVVDGPTRAAPLLAQAHLIEGPEPSG